MTQTTDPFERIVRCKDNGSGFARSPSAFSRHKGLVNVIANDPGTGEGNERAQEGARD
jgi:hypothetical protein